MMGPTATEIFGTDEPPAPRRRLQAGDLAAVLEEGNLRYITFRGAEVLRAINYLARDTAWRTYAASITDLAVTESQAAFRVAYKARCEGPEGCFDYAMTITGTADGTLAMAASGIAVTDFPTNRTGFVLLHPAEVAGAALLIETDDGACLSRRFPLRIDPDAPATGIRALTHEPKPGLSVRVSMTGDAFEMEDQRNWADASFKTFVRPLAKPRPYVLAKGTRDEQSVTLHVAVSSPRDARRSAPARRPRLIGPAIGTMPQMALFADRPAALAGDPGAVPAGLAQYLVLRWSPEQPAAELASGLAVAAAIGVAPVIEAILPARNAVAEIAQLRAAIGSDVGHLLIAPEREFKSSPRGSLPSGEIATDDLVAELRATGFAGRIVAGTPSFFTEFNRNPPGPAADAVYFGGCAVVHAADDVSVMETVSVYPAILASAATLGGNRPSWLGPCTIGARHPPYGPSVTANPARGRVAMAGDDPRHGALFGAAYAVGIAAACAGSEVACLLLAAPFGPFGVIGPQGTPRPLMAVHAALAGAAGCVRRKASLPGLAVVAWEAGEGVHLLAANTGETTVQPDLPATAQVRLLSPDAAWIAMKPQGLQLPPYRTAFIALSSDRDA